MWRIISLYTAHGGVSDFKYWDLQIFPGFLETLLSGGDSVFSRENPFDILGSPEKLCDACGDSRENLLEILAVVII